MRAWFGHSQALDLLGARTAGVRTGLWTADSFPPPDGADEVEFIALPFDRLDYDRAFGSLPRLRVVQLSTAGYDHVVPHLRPGMTLCNATGVHEESVAEWVVTVILALLRDIPRYARLQEKQIVERYEADELRGKNVLIIGQGPIGKAVERCLTPFGASVVRMASRARAGVHGPDDLYDLLPVAQIVVIVAAATPGTLRMVDARFLAALPDEAILVNAARGAMVVQDDLVRELHSGRIRAALDAATPDPLPSGHPLLAADGLLYTPHVGGHTRYTLSRLYDLIADQIARYVDGQPPRNVVARGPGSATLRSG